MSISHQQFLEQFENQTLDPNYFDHRGHIRLAWLYLNDATFDQAHNAPELPSTTRTYPAPGPVYFWSLFLGLTFCLLFWRFLVQSTRREMCSDCADGMRP